MGMASLLPLGLSLISSAFKSGDNSGGNQSASPPPAAPALAPLQPFFANHQLMPPNGDSQKQPSVFDPLNSAMPGDPSMPPASGMAQSPSLIDLLRGMA